MRAERKGLGHRAAATAAALFCRTLRKDPAAHFIEDISAVIAQEHGIPPLNREKGDKKKAQVVINPLQVCLG